MSNRIGFCLAFVIITSIAGAITYKNLREYNKQNELQITGVRTLGCVKSCADTRAGRRLVRLHFTIGEKTYESSKEIKSAVSPGDSLPVYYLPRNPRINGIAIN
jgi:hypothetical protein